MSPRDADTSAAENGVHIRTETNMLYIWADIEATNGLTGSGKNSANAKDSLGSPRRDDDWFASRSGNAAL